MKKLYSILFLFLLISLNQNLFAVLTTETENINLNQNIIQEEEQISSTTYDKTDNVKTRLSDYKITNPTFKSSVNFAFVRDTQTFKFIGKYKNSENQIKTRKHALQINSIGVKIELSLKINLICILGDINLYNTSKGIELDFGIDLRSPILDITYAPFKEISGGILVIGIPVLPDSIAFIGTISDQMHYKKYNDFNLPNIVNSIAEFYKELYQQSPLLLAAPFIGIGASVVTGGSLIPLDN